MLKYFLDQDGKKHLVKDCLEKKILSNQFPLSYLHMCADEREWKGIPSTTQLINGTRMEFLKLFVPYAIDPRSRAFAILGTKAHKKFEQYTPPESFAELKLSDDEKSGIIDCLEEQPNGNWWLIDYKTWGSYKATLALGLEKKKRPMLNNKGNPVLYKKNGNGYKKGESRQESYFIQNSALVDIWEAELQLNRYRNIIEKYFDIEIDKMKLFLTIRDGGTFTAKNRGIIENIYYIDVKELPDEEVESYFSIKRKILMQAIEFYVKDHPGNNFFVIQENLDFDLVKKHCPPECTAKEAWQGRRCQGYCDVSEFCQKLGCSYLESLNA